VFFGLDIPFLISSEVAVLGNFILNDLWTYREAEHKTQLSWASRLLSYNVIALGGIVIAWLVFSAMKNLGAPEGISFISGIFIGFLCWNYILNRHITWARHSV
jgi:putative flippase GtrA